MLLEESLEVSTSGTGRSSMGYGMRPSGDLLADDYTHPSDKGHEAIARVLAELGYAPLA
jgi:hypothetical protein